MIHARTLRALEFDRVTRRLAGCCQSETGRARALDLAPLPDEEAVLEAQKLYDETATWASRPAGDRGAPQQGGVPGDFPDVSGLLAAVGEHGAAGADCDADAFWALRTVLVRARDLQEAICVTGAEDAWPRLMRLATNPPLPAQLTASLTRCIGEDGTIRDESSPELFQTRVELRRLHQTCVRRVRSFAEEHNILGYLQDEFMTLSSDRYVLPFKANYKGRMQGIIHDWSQTGETCYFEPMFLVELNNRIQELKREEREAERQVLRYLAVMLEDGLAGARAALNLLTELDVLQAKRRLAEAMDGRCVPLTGEAEGICLNRVRHPLLLLAEIDAVRANPNTRRGEDVRRVAQRRVRPLDIVLRPGERALIVTGGNAGGKTVCLKTLGLCAAMTLAGLPVPAEAGSHLPWFNRVDAFIGDEQSIDDNVSTFTAQIRHLARAWRHLDSAGLALLDEFGAGTDPAQGAALAQAVIDELIAKSTFVLAATHFPALKSYALTRERARAASMLFDADSRRPLYELAYDQVGASQALDVAREHGMPEAIIRRAEHYLLQDGQDATTLLARLNDLAAERSKEIAQLKVEELKAKQAAQRYRERLEQDRLRLYEEVRARAQELMAAWKENRATHKQALRQMAQLRAELARPAAEAGAVPSEAASLPAPGDTVTHTVFRKKGRVTEVDERKKRVRLDLGGVCLWADVKDISFPGKETVQAQPQQRGKVFGRVAAPQEEPSTPSNASAQSARAAEGAAFSIDVRGLRADDAIAQVQACIDRAWLAEFREVEVVHGRGTGALRRAIHAWLSTCSAVASYTLAPADRGGDGMTIVTLN